MKESPLILTHLSKDFGKNTAVADVSLVLTAGEIFALVGPNGSGKSTLIKMIVGLLDPSRGEISVFSQRQPEASQQIATSLGYIPDDPSAYTELTGREFLWLVAKLRNIDTVTAKTRMEELLTLFPLGNQADELMSNYSRGTKQKFAFLAAIMNQPKLLVIDEPISGLDPASADVFKAKIRQLVSEGTTVFFATHILQLAKEVSDRIGFLVNARLVAVKKNKPGLKLKEMYRQIVKQ